MKKKIKLVDFLEFVNFRDYTDSDDYNTKIIRIEYPDKDTHDNYSKDRYFEYGVYNFGVDNRKRFIQTINPYILNCYVSDIRVNDDNILTIYVTTEDWIDDENLDCEDYELEGYEDSKSIDRLDNKIQKIYICSPLRGNIDDNINKAKEYCKFVVAKMKAMPVCPHIYFTQFLDDNNELEREIGMDFGLRLLSECDRVIVFDNNGISEGMKKEIELANSINIPVGYWSSGVYDLL